MPLQDRTQACMDEEHEKEDDNKNEKCLLLDHA